MPCRMIQNRLPCVLHWHKELPSDGSSGADARGELREGLGPRHKHAQQNLAPTLGVSVSTNRS